MNSVFVPTDFSRSSNGGLALGALIAEKTKSPLTLHHNISALVNWDSKSLEERLEEPQVLGSTVEAERLLAGIMNGGLPDGLVVSKYLTHGVTANEIVESASKLKAGLIVMGSHGIEDAGRNFIGSTVQKVIRLATVPVILAKQRTTQRMPRKIVFPFSFNENIQKPFARVLQLAAQWDATIHLLFVNTPAKFKDTKSIRSEMERFAAAYPEQKFVMEVYDHTDVVTGIIEHARYIDADLIALVSHDRLHQPKYLIGITETVVFHSEIPVLSINSRNYKPGYGEAIESSLTSAQEID